MRYLSVTAFLIMTVFLFSQPITAQTGVNSSGIRIGVKMNPPSTGQSFDFVATKHGQQVATIRITGPADTASFPVDFYKGDTIDINWTLQNQMICLFNGQRSKRVIVNGPEFVTASCGFLAAVYIDKLGINEYFKFELNNKKLPKDTLEVSRGNQGGAYFMKNRYLEGDTLWIQQIAGPRICNVPAYTVMQNTNTFITAGCGNPGGGDGSTHRLGLKMPDLEPGGYYTFYVPTMGGQEGFGINVRDSVYYFSSQFYYGDTVKITKQLGAKTILFNPSPVVFANKDLIVSGEDAAQAPTKRLGIQLSYVDPAEKFMFRSVSSRGGVEVITIDAGGKPFYFNYKFKKGDTASITQIGGRAVLLTNGNAYFGDADVIAFGNTGAPPVKTNLAGTYSAPPGSVITIRTDANEELTLTAPDNNTGSIGFSFQKKYESGAPYSIAIKTAPANCNCAVVPAASGTIPIDSTELGIVCSPATELVSRSNNNQVFNTYYETSAPVIGGKGGDEGRFVAFVSYGTGLDGAGGKYRQIFIRDMKAGVTRLISRAPDGSEGNGNSFSPAIAADGKSVAFESYATNLSANDNNNGIRDVYVWREGSGVSLVSKGTGGSGNAESYEPVISGDGTVIAFSSSASNLTYGVDGNSIVNVFIVDNSGAIQLLSKDPKTQKGVGGAGPSISDNGNKVVFCSSAYTLVENDNNNLWDIFLWQTGMPGVKKISTTSSGGDRDQGTESASRMVWPAISGNGNYVAYATTATNMVSGDNNKLQDIFICDLAGGIVKRISVAANNTEGDGDSPVEQGGKVGIDYYGNWITYNTSAGNLGVAKGNIILQNTQTGKIIPVTNSVYNTTGRPMVSRSGAYVVAGCSEKLDTRFVSSGIFLFFKGQLIQ